MAFNLESMKVDYRKLLNVVPTQRVQLAQGGLINDLLNALTPGQIVSLFPRYYRDQLPDVGQVNQYNPSLNVALSGGTKFNNSPDGKNSTYLPAQSPGLKKEMTPEEKALRELYKQAGLDGVGSTATAAMTNENGRVISTANTNLKPVERALLDTIAQWESPDYNTIVGSGGKFDDFSDHPRVFGTQDSTAAGRYQFTKTTWDGIVTEYNNLYPDDPITDFSPINQDKAALYLAKKDYKRRTKRDLEVDLENPPENFGELIKYGLGGSGDNTTWQAFQIKAADDIQKMFDDSYERNVGYVKEIEAAAKEVKEIGDVVKAFDPSMLEGLDQRLLSKYESMSEAQKVNFERALAKLGTETFNETMKKQPVNDATIVAASTDGSSFSQTVQIDNDVMTGQKPFLSGHDFAVPIYTNGKPGKPFDENLSGLTPEAIERLKQQAIAAKAAGLTKLELYGAQDHAGHASHGAGTETDLVGYNADGSTWSRDQRATTALGAVQMGADRVGMYAGNGLHVGKTGEVADGPKAPGAWGPGGQTSGVPVQAFTPGLERDLAAYLKGEGPMPTSEALNEHRKKMEEADLKRKAEQLKNADPVSASQVDGPDALAMSTGGEIPPGENIVGLNMDTGKPEFYANDRERIRIDPAELENTQQPNVITQEDIAKTEAPAQPPVQNRVDYPIPTASPVPEVFEEIAAGYNAAPPSAMRALNRARLHGEDSSSLVNKHFA